jgi:hypothetical protein
MYKPKYEIRRKMWDEKHGVVFLLSVVTLESGTAAMWSTHKVHKDNTLDNFKHFLQRSHDQQIDRLKVQENLNEPQEYKLKTVQDITKNQLNA